MVLTSRFFQNCGHPTAHGPCRQYRWYDNDNCYYHGKLKEGLLDNAEGYNVDDEDFE